MGVMVIIMKYDNKQIRKIAIHIFTILVVIFGISKHNMFKTNTKITETSNIIALQSNNEYNLEEEVVNLINENNEVFNFYANMFGISITDLKQNIINSNEGKTLDRNNIGNTNKTYDSLDKNIIDYLFYLRKTNNKLFKQEITNAKDYSKDYIYGLINYFSNIYGNVDYDVLAAIAYIESGNLNAKYMLKCNNIYGGMGSKGLIKYSNIEFGVLSYVKMMSTGYYAKGLTTVELIAKKYNPGSTTWVGNINKTRTKFLNKEKIDFNTLINLK